MKKYLFSSFLVICSMQIAEAQVTDAIYNWAKSAGATVTNENGNGIAVDVSGNVYIPGY